MNEMLGTPADRAGAPRVDCYPAHAAFPKWGGVGVRIVTFEACSGYRGRDGHCWPPTGSPEAIDRPRSGRIEARTGLRMMPTFLNRPYHSVRRVFPDTAGRAAFRGDLPGFHASLSLLPTSAARRPVCIHPSYTSW